MSNNDQEKSTPICTVDPYQYLQIKPNPDGTITRLINFPSIPATPDPASSSPVLTQDFPLNPTRNTSVRIFFPKHALSQLSLSSGKLPIIVYFHGGGFVLLRADSAFFHALCSELATHAPPAIIVSVDYRLAPENRLPAAYDDAVDALRWIGASAKGEINIDWLSKYGDYSNCFLMGSSAGGNIAYHAALRCSDFVDDLRPLRLKGLILHQPFFGGSGRTGSELRLIDNPYLPLSGSDMFWELALPTGSGRDHEFCDPFRGVGSGQLEKMMELGWRVLVTGCSGDPLVDRLLEFVSVMEEKGVRVKGHFSEGGYHGVELMDPSKSEPLIMLIKSFMDSC